MNALPPLLGPNLPPSAWSGTTQGAGRPVLEPGAAAAGVDWFSASASGRTLTVQRDLHAAGDVDSWAKALVDHLLEPGDDVR